MGVCFSVMGKSGREVQTIVCSCLYEGVIRILKSDVLCLAEGEVERWR